MCNAWNHSLECCCDFGGNTKNGVIKSQQIIEKEIRKLFVKIVGADGYILPKDYSMGIYYNNREYVELAQVQSTLTKNWNKSTYKLIKYLNYEVLNLDMYEITFEVSEQIWDILGLSPRVRTRKSLFIKLEYLDNSMVKASKFTAIYIKTDSLLCLIKNLGFYNPIDNIHNKHQTLDKTSSAIFSISKDGLEVERNNSHNNTAISKWHECNSSDRDDASKYWGYLAREYNGSRFGSYPMCDDYGDESFP